MRKITRILLIVFGILAILVLVVPFLIPVPPLTGLVPPDQLADPDSRFLDVDGITVHYKEMGTGDTVFLLLHGFGANLFTWHLVMEPLAEYGRVIAFDRPAFGLTERPLRPTGGWDGNNPYTPESQLILVAGLLDALGVEKAILVGNSAGGTIAMNFALEYPERVQALILADPAVFAGGGAPSFIKPLLALPQFRLLGPLVARSFLGNADSLLDLAWHDPSSVTPETIAGYSKPTQVENWDIALWEFTLASSESTLTERLAEITLPTLVITGDDDRIVPTEDSIRLAGELPNAELVVISGCGHVPHEEKPAEFMAAVDEFLLGLPLK